MVGYLDFVHLAPAILGAVAFAMGLGLTHRQMYLKPLPWLSHSCGVITNIFLWPRISLWGRGGPAMKTRRFTNGLPLFAMSVP